jgi:hypothetical protein
MGPSEAAGGHDAGFEIEPVEEMNAGQEERRPRPLEWLSEPADREQDLRAWLDYRRAVIGSVRAERWRR